jgi:hypothetical protein
MWPGPGGVAAAPGLGSAELLARRPTAIDRLFNVRDARSDPEERGPGGGDGPSGAHWPSPYHGALTGASPSQVREIAQALFVSMRTVATHLGHAYDQLGVTGRAELPTVLGPQGVSKLDAARPTAGAQPPSAGSDPAGDTATGTSAAHHAAGATDLAGTRMPSLGSTRSTSFSTAPAWMWPPRVARAPRTRRRRDR